ncbi:WXG100 family type VII secretion target [Nocardia higoensis]|uniref:WXG100 family type VII secretion target n=1 Tax=Nocardia higoensis TaxID=228599 RepID=A0ABS0DE51_9NOCA|nr:MULTISPECIES: WXG100 family type VII secretion target [Nocardia]MBF6356163.1 WXG100 family type VII secretion target [Nocardia higoensis]
MSDGMLYDEAAITALYNDLHDNYNKLTQEAENMSQAAKKMNEAWQGSGLEGFNREVGKWEPEYQDALALLNKIAAAVDSAMQNAFHTDKTIGDGFGA